MFSYPGLTPFVAPRSLPGHILADLIGHLFHKGEIVNEEDEQFRLFMDKFQKDLDDLKRQLDDICKKYPPFCEPRASLDPPLLGPDPLPDPLPDPGPDPSNRKP